jgi:hypothetical protein
MCGPYVTLCAARIAPAGAVGDAVAACLLLFNAGRG